LLQCCLAKSAESSIECPKLPGSQKDTLLVLRYALASEGLHVIQVVTGGADGTVAVWLAASRSLTRIQVIRPPHVQPVTAVAMYMPDVCFPKVKRRHVDQPGSLRANNRSQSGAEDGIAERPNAWLAVAFASGAVNILANDTSENGFWYTARVLETETGDCQSLHVGFEGEQLFMLYQRFADRGRFYDGCFFKNREHASYSCMFSDIRPVASAQKVQMAVTHKTAQGAQHPLYQSMCASCAGWCACG
jgi:hypothetical protein